MRPTFLLLGALLAAGACRAWRPDASRDVAASAGAWPADSLRWVRDLEVWQRDSAVIDSLAATVRTDSLYRLSRSLLTSAAPGSVYGELVCERWRLAWRHGSRPASLAIARTEDTVWRGVDAEALAGVEARLSREPVALDRARCGEPGIASSPVHGSTPLHGVVPRPEMPRRP